MYWNEERAETRNWDAVSTSISNSTSEVVLLIEDLRSKLDEARAKIEELEGELRDLRESIG